jgi:hypothetical protein
VTTYSPHDTIELGISGFPWPKSAALDWLDGAEAFELCALVKANGIVGSLAMIAPSGTFVSTGGEWKISDFNLIDDNWVDVADEAWKVFQEASWKTKYVPITNLPVRPNDDFRVWAMYADPSGAGLDLYRHLNFGGVPVVAGVEDLEAAVPFGSQHEIYRSYLADLIKRRGWPVTLPWDESA